VIWALAFGIGVCGVLWLTQTGYSVSDRRIAIVLAVNFLLYLAGQAIFDIAAPWLWFLAVDAVCAFIILHPPASRTAAWVGSVYVLQLIIHVAYAVGSDGTRLYLDLLAFGGWCQLVILATGAIHGRRRKVAAARDYRGAVAGLAAAHREGVD
jgi:hypothetical protein